jgi:hypothetical protein
MPTSYNDKAEPFVWTKKKVRQRPFKGRRITQLGFRVLGSHNPELRGNFVIVELSSEIQKSGH